MIRDLRNQFEEKYLEERKTISREMEVDMGVATDVLVAHVRNKDLNIPLKYDFTGSENLEYTTIENEIVEMLKVPEELL